MIPALWVRETRSPRARATAVPDLRTTVGGFPRYSNAVRALPPGERRKILSMARIVVASLARGGRPVYRIRLHGHADTDTPRRPAFEMRMSLTRARAVRSALASAIDRLAASLPGPPPLPVFSSRIDWRISGAGASRLAVPSARTEAQRARNRRVEIALYRRPVTRSRPVARSRRISVVATQAPDAARVDAIIQEFLDRIGDSDIDRKNCFAAGSQVIRILEPGAPRNLSCGIAFGGVQLATSRSYRAPFSRTVKCCAWNADCSVSRFKSGCGHCSGVDGPYLILNYDSTSLARAVARAKCILDQGCVVRAGVLSGICDDKPDLGCANNPRRTDEVWRACPEHWLVIIGYVGDAFVFWDSARTSRIAKGGHEFGLLHYNSTEGRLTTGSDMSRMDVNPSGFHTWNTSQKRYQVLALQTGGRYRPATGSC